MSDTESTQLSESSGEGSHYSSQETEIGGGTDLENQSESPSETKGLSALEQDLMWITGSRSV